jgi:hypothetical protein
MPAIDWSGIEPRDLYRFAGLYQPNDMNAEAEQMYVRALRGYEKAWGAEHIATLDMVNNLNVDQGKVTDTEGMYVRAL